MRYRELARRLRALGCEEIPRRCPFGRPQGAAPTKPFSSFRVGTIRHILRQLGLDWETFQQT